MSNFLNKIPISPITVPGNPSIPGGSVFGTNFSILQTGGYMEVFKLSDLSYIIPPATTGVIEYTGNTIPIQFSKGSGSVFSQDVLTLNSDNISSGRRKIGMLVYVYETNKIYQHTIDNYETLWDNATGATGPGGSTVVISNYGTTVKNNTPEGVLFINSWTASTVEGYNGYDDSNATWRVLKTGGVSITGGTFNDSIDTLFLNNSTGGTITITGFTDYYTTGFTFNPATYDLTIERNDGLPNLTTNLSILSSDVTITGGTYNSSTGTATFTNNTGGTFNVTGFLTGFTDIYVTGGTFNKVNETLTLSRNDNNVIDISGFTDVYVTGGTYNDGTAIFTNNTGGTFNVNGFYTGATDVFVTGGTYNDGTATFINNTGGTFNVNGFYTGATDVFVTGATKTDTVATFTNNTGGTFTLTGLTDVYVTGGTYNDGTTTFTNNTGGTFNVNGFYTGATDVFVTGGTYNDGTAIFTNNTGGTFNVNGFYTGATDVFVTGATKTDTVATFTNNTGGTFTLTGLTDVYTTGITVSNSNVAYNNTNNLSAYTLNFSGINLNIISNDVNKSLTFSASTGLILPTLNQGQIFIGDTSNQIQSRSISGDISLDYSGLTTIQPKVVSYGKIQNVTTTSILGSTSLTGGTIEEIPLIEAYITSGTSYTLITDNNNWDINGFYTGTTITGTYQGQSCYDTKYWYTAVDDNNWIRLIRG